MTVKVTTVPTQAAPWTVVVDDGVVIVSGFSGEDDTVARLSDEQRAAGVEHVDDLGPVTDAMLAYLDGDVSALDDIPVAQPGGPFHQQAWAAMRRIPAGETWSYARLAAEAGNAEAIRAAGTACARNRVAPFVPCHRVVRSDGSLGGYYYGLAVKRWLLAHEQGSDQLAL